MVAQTLTVPALLAEGSGQLTAAGIFAPRREARLLLAAALQRHPDDLVVNPTGAVDRAQAARYREFISRRTKKEPRQYILGQEEFYSLDFAVTPAVLIPRPETELLVERALQLTAAEEAPLMADLGTGSGAIAVALAKERPDARVAAVDLSAAALAVARGNARRHQVAARISFYEGCWGLPLLAAGWHRKLHLVASNPPYVVPSELPTLQPEVRLYEPPLALLTEEGDELAPFRAIIAQATELLRPGGWLLLECAPPQGRPLSEMMNRQGWQDVAVIADFNGLPRLVQGRWGQKDDG